MLVSRFEPKEKASVLHIPGTVGREGSCAFLILATLGFTTCWHLLIPLPYLAAHHSSSDTVMKAIVSDFLTGLVP